jgi:hypothetical protein
MAPYEESLKKIQDALDRHIDFSLKEAAFILSLRYSVDIRGGEKMVRNARRLGRIRPYTHPCSGNLRRITRQDMLFMLKLPEIARPQG